jgi:YHS domain-containing protein
MPIHTDPVCHMQVDQNTAAAVSEYQGRRYYFCSPGCKEKFDRSPGQYAGGPR